MVFTGHQIKSRRDNSLAGNCQKLVIYCARLIRVNAGMAALCLLAVVTAAAQTGSRVGTFMPDGGDPVTGWLAGFPDTGAACDS